MGEGNGKGRRDNTPSLLSSWVRHLRRRQSSRDPGELWLVDSRRDIATWRSRRRSDGQSARPQRRDIWSVPAAAAATTNCVRAPPEQHICDISAANRSNMDISYALRITTARRIIPFTYTTWSVRVYGNCSLPSVRFSRLLIIFISPIVGSSRKNKPLN